MGSIAQRVYSSLPVAILTVLLVCGEVAIADDLSVNGEIDVSFELVNSEGDSVGIDDFRGRNVLLAFGFTRCAHICPMIAANMARAIKSADKPVVGIFISVDTERDSPQDTHAYARGFSDLMVGLGGDHAQIVAAANNFDVSFVVTKSEKAYSVQHTPDIFLIGPSGALIDTFALNTPADRIAAAMQ